MRVNSTYRNAIRSRQKMRAALLDLLQEKTISEITVTELSRRAKVNRGTFYAHYPDLHELLHELTHEGKEKILAILAGVNEATPEDALTQITRRVSALLQEDAALYRCMVRLPEADHLFSQLKIAVQASLEKSGIIPQELRERPCYQVQMSFLVNGLLSLYRQWLMDQENFDLEQIPEMIDQLMRVSVPEQTGNTEPDPNQPA